MFQNRSLPSKDPERKYLSFTGLKAIAVTKSWCEKIRRQSSMVMYHSRTVLSMLEDKSQSVWLQHRSRMSPLCPAYSLNGSGFKMFRAPSSLSSAQTRTILSCPAVARYSPVCENFIVHTASSCAWMVCMSRISVNSLYTFRFTSTFTCAPTPSRPGVAGPCSASAECAALIAAAVTARAAGSSSPLSEYPGPSSPSPPRRLERCFVADFM
mmetsp:Transcript_7963/g.31515  ORF Transcript_7963/g.31515 Transcript_7963/m.31515 type:complete len:211 (+) Transcript_7963:728-1360(+)